MVYVLELILKKVKGGVVCVLGDRTEEMESPEVVKSNNLKKRYELLSIRAKDDQIVLELEQLPPANDMNSPWVQEYKKEYGHEPSFFDF
jgi:hypothetical protein